VACVITDFIITSYTSLLLGHLAAKKIKANKQLSVNYIFQT